MLTPSLMALLTTLFEVINLRSNLEDLHLDLRSYNKQRHDSFDELKALSESRNRKYPRVKHLRMVGVSLYSAVLELWPNLVSLGIAVLGDYYTRTLTMPVDRLNSLRRLALTIYNVDAHIMPP